MSKTIIAIATVGKKGLGDEVADTFAKANTLTLASIDKNKVHLEVLDNPAAPLTHGRGRTIVPFLKGKGVNVVVASEFGMGASALLKQFKIGKVVVQAGVKVDDIIRDEKYKSKVA
ncbi:MAG: NifB/NifX family molybdenum-iron cluster-binding protein [Candidatus Hadarchaeota archaeon]